MSAALELYGSRLAIHRSRSSNVVARLRDGSTHELHVDRWLGPASAADRELLALCRGPVLDIGCGPGRHVHALAQLGVMALGVDVSPDAVRLARRRGAAALEASVFDRLPGAGTWRTALLLDGNIGIGGDPAALLARLRSLLAPGGSAFVEAEGPDVPASSFDARLEAGDRVSEWFRWARSGVGALESLAWGAGLEPSRRWERDGRWFVELQQPLDAHRGRSDGDASPRGG